jgi:hypothetical protein
MQTAPPPYDCSKRPTFTETVLAQLRKWPWIEMVHPDHTAHNASASPIEISSSPAAPDSSQNYDPHPKTHDPEDSW